MSLKMTTNIDGFGTVTWWGFSPALALGLTDLLKRGLSKASTSVEVSSVHSDFVNILLVGCGDLRHVLTTLAKAHKHSDKPIHFYVAEGCLEVFARHMLFLALLFEPPDELGLQEKVELFLELYGNSLVRPHTADYYREKASELIKMVTDEDYLKKCIPILDISKLKYKERDLLEGIFKFWRNKDEKTFEISKYWESRLRQYLGVRYDSRKGVFDWDYNMQLVELAPVLASREYLEWRESGVAFRLRSDAPYDAANKTLASGLLLKQGEDRVARRGYWGDIVSSPYLAFGIESENKSLFEKYNGRQVKTSTDVCEFNLLSLVHKLTSGEEYSSCETASSDGHKQTKFEPTTSNQMGVIEELSEEEETKDEENGMEATKDKLEDKKEEMKKEAGDECGSTTDKDDKDNSSTHSYSGPLFNSSCRITFLPLHSPSEIGTKAKFRKLFDVAYFSNSMVHHLNNGIESTFAPGCTVILETAKFMLDLNKDKRKEYLQKITSMASSIGFEAPLPNKEDNPNHLAFIKSTTHVQ